MVGLVNEGALGESDLEGFVSPRTPLCLRACESGSAVIKPPAGVGEWGRGGGLRRAEGDLMSPTQRKTAINSTGFPRSEGLGGGGRGASGSWRQS